MISYDEVGGTSRFGYSTMVYDGYAGDPDTDPAPVPVIKPEPVPAPIPDPIPEPCTFSLSSTGATFKATGGSGSFSLYMSASCAASSVSASASASWVTISSMLSSGDSVKVTYAVSANSGVAREARIDISGQAYSIKQLATKLSNPNKPVKSSLISKKQSLR